MKVNADLTEVAGAFLCREADRCAVRYLDMSTAGTPLGKHSAVCLTDCDGAVGEGKVY